MILVYPLKSEYQFYLLSGQRQFQNKKLFCIFRQNFQQARTDSEGFENLLATFCENVIKCVKSSETIFVDSNLWKTKIFCFLKRLGFSLYQIEVIVGCKPSGAMAQLWNFCNGLEIFDRCSFLQSFQSERHNGAEYFMKFYWLVHR